VRRIVSAIAEAGDKLSPVMLDELEWLVTAWLARDPEWRERIAENERLLHDEE
jgi:hypothetical protein